MTLEQRRARFALLKIDEVKNQSDREKFKTQLLRLPARLHTSGLGQTVAFYLSASEGHPEPRICGWIGEWLSEVGIYERGDLIRNIVGTDMPDNVSETKYRQAAVEARALSIWLKRFAEAFIGASQ